MHPLRSSSKHSIVSLLVRRSRVFRFTSFSKKGTFFRTPWLQRLGLLVFPEDTPHFTTASCFSVAHSAWSFLHTSFLLLPSKKKCQGESSGTWPRTRQHLQRKTPGSEAGNSEQRKRKTIDDDDLFRAAAWRKHVQARCQQTLRPLSVVVD